jgi:hypothetical protein
MNSLNFNQSVGFPLETEILDEMQKAYSIFNALGAIVGNFTIISGCVVTETTATNGVVYINGEVLEFRGGVVQTNVIIVQSAQLREFEDGNSNDVIYTRWATFGTGTTQWPWADFKRGFETKEIPAALEFKEDKTTVAALLERVAALEAITTVNVPSGLIAIWGQAASLIPVGWTEYTPLRGRMAVGYDSAIPGFDTLTYASGSKTHTNTLAEMVPHVHDLGLSTGGANSDGGNDYVKNSTTATVFSTKSAGSGVAYDIMNPYRVVLYIQKT